MNLDPKTVSDFNPSHRAACPRARRTALEIRCVFWHNHAVTEASARHFGLVIAYLIPGFTALWGVSYASPAVRLWLLGAGEAGPNVGSFLYVVLASLGAGLVASAVRWALVDTLHHATGLRQPRLDDRRLAERLPAFDYLVDNHYRYYQFYGNGLVATLVAYAAFRCSPASAGTGLGLPELGVLLLSGVLVAGSRDALRKYYGRTALLLGTLDRAGTPAAFHVAPVPEPTGVPAERGGGAKETRHDQRQPPQAPGGDAQGHGQALEDPGDARVVGDDAANG